MAKMLLGQDRGYVPQPAPYEYKPESVFVRNKWISVLFLLLAIALGMFVWKSMQQPRRVLPAEPVYVEPIAAPAGH